MRNENAQKVRTTHIYKEIYGYVYLKIEPNARTRSKWRKTPTKSDLFVASSSRRHPLANGPTFRRQPPAGSSATSGWNSRLTQKCQRRGTTRQHKDFAKIFCRRMRNSPPKVRAGTEPARPRASPCPSWPFSKASSPRSPRSSWRKTPPASQRRSAPRPSSRQGNTCRNDCRRHAQMA